MNGKMAVAVREKQSNRWKWMVVYALVLLALCFLFYYYKEAYMGFRDLVRFFTSKSRVNQFVASFGPYAPITFIGLQALQVIFAPIPGELTGFIGGYLFGILPGFLYSTVGLTLGSLLSFLIARWFGLPLIRRFIDKEIMDKFDYLMEHQGAFFFHLLSHPGLAQRLLLLPPGIEPDAYHHFFPGLCHRQASGNPSSVDARPGDSLRALPRFLCGAGDCSFLYRPRRPLPGSGGKMVEE